MQIIRDFTRLHSGENLSRRLKFKVSEEFSDKKAKLGFITPKGNIYFTRELSHENGEGEFLIPSALLDGKGMLLSQLFIWNDGGFIGKSPIEEIPVYPSVDDLDCPVISEDTRKSLALLFEYIESKADSKHTHDERYYTKEDISELLNNNFAETHNHDGRYYTETEIDSLLSRKSDTGHSHSYTALSDKPQINGKTLSGDTDINKIMFRRVLTSADDCDRLFEDGWYVYSTASAPKNAPFPNASVIEVFGIDSTSTQKIQRAYRYGDPGHSAFRPLYNSKWSAWCVTEDFVVEKGTVGKWNYRKWYSGAAEAWGTVDIKLSKDSYSWSGDIYCASGYGTLPSGVFTSWDCISIDPIQWYQIGASGRITAGGTLEGNVFGKGSNMTSLKKDNTVSVNCVVKGKWK